MNAPAHLQPALNAEYIDVLVVGAGLSGIGAAVHLGRDCPHKSVAIWEARDAIGGTWDLFRYPGVRSDSDMHTLGYAFRPWKDAVALADGASIRDYIRETAQDHGIAEAITFDRKIVSADWSSAEACWTVTARDREGGEHRIRANFLFMCSGYYDYDDPYDAGFAGSEDFAGSIVHPQFWPEDLAYAGKRIVVIGSGATAVTIVPEMAKSAAHVTMLQRSPSYVMSIPRRDPIAALARRLLPGETAYRLIRAKNVTLTRWFYNRSRSKPGKMKTWLVDQVAKALGRETAAAHFTPSYNPWDQRVCFVPDGDLFDAIKASKADIVTDTIERFEGDGIRLASGELLPADIIVTATGLKILIAGGATISVDGSPVDFSQRFNYKGVMFSGIPNFAITFGYTNASWTLKADLTSEYIGRVLNAMDERGARVATPVADDDLTPEAMLDFTSSYVLRASATLPKQGHRTPWKLNQNYPLDRKILRKDPVDDGVIAFTSPKTTVESAA